MVTKSFIAVIQEGKPQSQLRCFLLAGRAFIRLVNLRQHPAVALNIQSIVLHVQWALQSIVRSWCFGKCPVKRMGSLEKERAARAVGAFEFAEKPVLQSIGTGRHAEKR